MNVALSWSARRKSRNTVRFGVVLCVLSVWLSFISLSFLFQVAYQGINIFLPACHHILLTVSSFSFTFPSYPHVFSTYYYNLFLLPSLFYNFPFTYYLSFPSISFRAVSPFSSLASSLLHLLHRPLISFSLSNASSRLPRIPRLSDTTLIWMPNGYDFFSRSVMRRCSPANHPPASC